ncbi:MAG: GAF domain-containing protein [Anaerolineales bacterium]|nr:GAF domain-containing protein [Anaerolineales bacterium]
MEKENSVPRGLRPQELEAVYAISTAIAQSINLDVALDQIVKLTRPVFIFDNMVLYLAQGDDLEPAYARVIGRGRSAEADLAWGEGIAREVLQSQRTVVRQEKLSDWETERLSWREFVGLLLFGDQPLGSLVFGRFGGPSYAEDQVRLAEFIASQISKLLEHQTLVEQVAELEAERRLRKLQSDFIATVSHELVTPLGFIKGYATTLMRQDANWDSATQREFLTVISEEADRLRDLIDDLLDSSRLQSGAMRMQYQRIDLEQLLQEVVLREINRTAGQVIQIQLRPSAIAWVDPIRIAQVFENLFSNAVKYAPGSPIYVGLELENGFFHITVKDQGPGIAPEHIPHLFERFYRVVKPETQVHGTGLGLFICRQIVEAHGGEISVQSEVGYGTTFHVRLPVERREQPDSLQEAKP